MKATIAFLLLTFVGIAMGLSPQIKTALPPEEIRFNIIVRSENKDSKINDWLVFELIRENNPGGQRWLSLYSDGGGPLEFSILPETGYLINTTPLELVTVDIDKGLKCTTNNFGRIPHNWRIDPDDEHLSMGGAERAVACPNRNATSTDSYKLFWGSDSFRCDGGEPVHFVARKIPY